MENKETAVEWLVNQLYEKMEMKGDGRVFDEILNQAKEIEKEQIIKAACYEPFLGDLPKSEGEYYYEQTFKKN